jgi:hypothetical protein
VKVVEIVDGSCGFATRIAAHLEDSVQVGITVSSECDAVAKWGGEIERVDWRECLGPRPFESHLWQSAIKTLRHRSCPVLTGVLRAIEAEVGAAKPARILIRFLSRETAERKADCQRGEKEAAEENG